MAAPDFGYADLLAHNALLHGDALAVAGDCEPLTHRELAAAARRLAHGLAGAGVRAGDRIAVLSNNRREVLELLGAAALAEATLVLLNTRSSAAEVAALLEDCAPALLLAQPGFEPLLADVRGGFACHAIGPAQGRLAAWEALAGGGEGVLPALDAGAALVGIPTAAVDGRARIALLSHAALLHQALQLAHAWSLGPTDRHLCILPLYHTAGLGLTLAAQLAGGATVLLERFDPQRAVQAIGQHRASFCATFPPMLAALLDAADAQGAALASLRAVTGLEAPGTIARLHARCPGAVFWSAYGQTETAGLVSLAPAAQRPGAAGRPLPSVALRIEQPGGGPAAPGESGEIVLRGPCVFSGYWRRPAETAHAARGGWHHTGDLGRLDAQGWLWFEGRAPDKALIKSGGENVYPAEVEQALLAHPAVAEAVVFGVPDQRWGEAVRAVCVRRAGHAVEAAQLIDFLAGRIARFKRPRAIAFSDALPKLADGTPDRAAIRAGYCAPEDARPPTSPAVPPPA